MSIQYFKEAEYVLRSAYVVAGSMYKIAESKRAPSMLLTGGKTAQLIYKELNKILSKKIISKFCYYFGDERCVPKNDKESNYALAETSLFSGIDITEICIHPMFIMPNIKYEECADRYSKIIPDEVDIALFSLGGDGHIASIFPCSPLIMSGDSFLSKVEYVKSPIHPIDRLTISPRYIKKLNNIFIFVYGKDKTAIFEELADDSDNVIQYPARLLKNGNWLVTKECIDD